jgi:hypothetical protein
VTAKPEIGHLKQFGVDIAFEHIAASDIMDRIKHYTKIGILLD